MSNTDTQKTSDTSSAANGRVGSSDSSASDTPRTDARLVLCNHGEYRVPADFARQLERELFAFRRSNERIIRDHNDRLAELRFAENMQRAAERETAALAERVKLLEAIIAGLTHMRTIKIAGLGEMVELLTSQANWDAVRAALSSPNTTLSQRRP